MISKHESIFGSATAQTNGAEVAAKQKQQASKPIDARKMEDAREARRKRLAERKTDRLAFITGQSSSPSQSAAQGVTSRENTFSETPSHHHTDDIAGNVLSNSNKQAPLSEPGTTRSHEHEIESEDAQITANYTSREQKNEVASNEQKGEDIFGRLFTTSMIQKPAGHDRPRATTESRNIFSAIFTSRAIDHSVSTTENLRLAVAFSVSLLVVTSYKGFVFGSAILSSIVGLRPLFFVLLTSVTIILGSVFLKQGADHRHGKDTRKMVEEEKGWPNDLGRIFEIGRMVHKVLGAAFMDCSVCAVIVICGIAV